MDDRFQTPGVPLPGEAIAQEADKHATDKDELICEVCGECTEGPMSKQGSGRCGAQPKFNQVGAAQL